MPKIHLIDIILLVPLVFGFWDGYKKGFVLVVVGCLALILGIAGAFKLMQVGIDFLIHYFPHLPHLLPFFSFALIFMIISVGLYALGLVLKKSMNLIIFSGTLDNIIGGLTGIFQWAFTFGVIAWLIHEANIPQIEIYTSESAVFKVYTKLPPLVIKKFDFVLPFADDLFSSIRHVFKEL